MMIAKGTGFPSEVMKCSKIDCGDGHTYLCMY